MMDKIIKNAVLVGHTHTEYWGFLWFSVMVEYEDGEMEDIFSFFPDEWWVNPNELVGETRDRAIRLCRH